MSLVGAYAVIVECPLSHYSGKSGYIIQETKFTLSLLISEYDAVQVNAKIIRLQKKNSQVGVHLSPKGETIVLFNFADT